MVYYYVYATTVIFLKYYRMQNVVMIHCSEDQLTYLCVILSVTLNIVIRYTVGWLVDVET